MPALQVPRIRLHTQMFDDNQYCWNALIQFVEYIRQLFQEFYPSHEEPFIYYEDGTVEMAFMNVLHLPLMKCLGQPRPGIRRCRGYEHWKAIVVQKRKDLGVGHEDEQAMFELDFLADIEFVPFAFRESIHLHANHHTNGFFLPELM